MASRAIVAASRYAVRRNFTARARRTVTPLLGAAARRVAGAAGRRAGRFVRGRMRQSLKRLATAAAKRVNDRANAKKHTLQRIGTALVQGTLYFKVLGADISKGVGRDQRIGDSVMYKGCRIEFHCRNAGSSPRQQLSVRMMLVRIKHTRPPGEDMFMADGQAGPLDFTAVPSNPKKLVRAVNKQRYWIKEQRTFRLFPEQAGTNAKYQITGKDWFPLTQQIKYETSNEAEDGVSELLPRWAIMWYCIQDDERGVATNNRMDIKFTEYWAN